MNAIVIYACSGLLARVLGLVQVGGTSLHGWIFEHAFVRLANPYNASLLYAAANVLAMFAIAWVMYRRGWFVRF
jgi:predicted acyltransferase